MRAEAVLHVNSNTSTYALNVGGNYNSNDNYGFFYFNANNTASNTNANLGSRHLVFSCVIAQVSPYRSVKILPLGQGLVGSSRKALRQTRRSVRAKESRIYL